ncbi:MAG: FKBP-type peptidyl-prolyl cis-trans isomerase [Clostridia bacterium]|nr:FKBP-type peptidyl-prolyl cis-trans isomerase [Clostridia bacterium]
MKKTIALLLCILLTAGLFAGCGGSKEVKETGLFKYDLDEYVTVGEYKGMKISSDDEDFLAVVKDQMEYDMSSASLGEEVEIASGKVQMGDTATITYVGTLDGVPFEGGTETSGYDLVIGSNSFIDGFEDGLIGAAIGSTVKLDLTFPEDYGNEKLNGQDVVFTVNVKKVTRIEYPEVDDEVAKKLGYKNAEDYNAYAFSCAVQTYCHEKLSDEAKVLKTPNDEVDYFVNLEIKNYEETAEMYGITLEEYFGTDVAVVKKQIREDYVDMMPYYLVLYYIAQKEDLIPTADEVEAEYEEFAKELSTESETVTADDLKDMASYNQMEYMIVYEDVRQFLFDNVVVE